MSNGNINEMTIALRVALKNTAAVIVSNHRHDGSSVGSDATLAMTVVTRNDDSDALAA